MHYRTWFACVLLLLAVGLVGCTDDPILAPTPGGESTGGSYGLLSFPTDSTDAEPEAQGQSSPASNPARF
ncbi:MAG: hypothetical protein AAF170_06015 [Bacteroidota bacterium]